MIRGLVASLTIMSLASAYTDLDYSKHSYSSIWDNDPVGSLHGRGRLDSAQAWSALHNANGQWFQLDLGDSQVVTGVVTKGRADTDQWVTSYRLQCEHHGAWVRIHEHQGVFIGNTDRTTLKTNMFDTPIVCDKIRFMPKTWHSHISMRAGVITEASDTQLVVDSCSASSEYFDGNWPCTKAFDGAYGLYDDWASSGEGAGNWIKLNFPRTLVTGINLHHRSGYTAEANRGLTLLFEDSTSGASYSTNIETKNWGVTMYFSVSLENMNGADSVKVTADTVWTTANNGWKEIELFGVAPIVTGSPTSSPTTAEAFAEENLVAGFAGSGYSVGYSASADELVFCETEDRCFVNSPGSRVSNTYSAKADIDARTDIDWTVSISHDAADGGRFEIEETGFTYSTASNGESFTFQYTCEC